MKTHVTLVAAISLGCCLLPAPAQLASAIPDTGEVQPVAAAPQSAALAALPSPDYAPGASAARAKPGRHGPFRTSSDMPLPKHAYSPFNNLDAPPERPLLPGRDVFPDRLAIKLKPAAAARTQSINSSLHMAALQQKFAARGLTGLERVFRNAQPPTRAVGLATPAMATPPASDQPDLTLWLRATCATNFDVRELARQLAEDPDVDVAEPDCIRRLAGYIPSGDADPLFASQWHLSAAKVPEAWAHLDAQGLPPGGNRDIVVAVIDTGVDYAHPDLAANMWVNSQEIAGNRIDDDQNGFVDDIHGCRVVSSQAEHTGDPQDDHGHGTHVAGIIGALAGNSNGVVGVAYNCQLMAIKAAQYSGVLSASDIAEGIHYAVEKGADVINMSFGGYARSQIEEDALAVAFGQCVLVAAAGNDGFPCEDDPRNPTKKKKPIFPASLPWVLGVMAQAPAPDGEGTWRAYFSNYDPKPDSPSEYELMAPGLDILSTLPNGQYAAWDGTSMAAPIVSGMTALLRTKFSDKETYSSRFIMGQLGATGPMLQSVTGKAGYSAVLSHTAEALSALTTSPAPKLSCLQHWIFDTSLQAANNDADGVVDAGETIDLAIVIRNQWGKADHVTVSLQAIAEGAAQADPYVTWVTDTVDYGAIGSFNWDDNGLLFSPEGEVTGVANPFRFQVSPDCPNDHAIPMELTMTCKNGLDPSDSKSYERLSRFILVAQKGRELPQSIRQDMNLDRSSYWIATRQCVIEPGVTVRVTQGTQIQFWSHEASDYIAPPGIVVQGQLHIEGTDAEPVELFPAAFHADKPVILEGNLDLSYARVEMPRIVNSPSVVIDHCILTQSRLAPATIDWSNCPGVNANVVTRTTCRGLRGEANGSGSFLDGAIRECQFVDCQLGYRVSYAQMYPWRFPSVFTNNVFMANREGFVPSTIYDDEANATIRNNAFLNRWHLGSPAAFGSWTLFASAFPSSLTSFDIAGNYWGTTSRLLISSAIVDRSDDVRRGTIAWEPILETPPESAYPFVVRVEFKDSSGAPTTILGPGAATFSVAFNRDMATNQPQVTFGPDTPITDYAVHALDGGWQNPRTWVGTFHITPLTGDGYQLIRIAGAAAADDPWLVTAEDTGRFRFEIITSGAEAMNLQATGGEGRVDLSWMQDDFDLLAGFNLYRSTSADGSYGRINSVLIPSHVKTWTDTDVVPGQPYYYKFTVIQTSMAESSFSTMAQGTPLDTIPPVLSHTPLTSAAPGLPVTLTADAADNVAVRTVTLHFRAIGAADYANRPMTRTTGDRYAATIEGSQMVSPGVEYYIEAADGVSTARSGRPEYPWQVIVVDRPVVNVVTPSSGPASGGTFVNLAGANFKAGATVSFGTMPADNVTVISPNQITCATAAHFPATVDVTVTNPDSQGGRLLRGYTYLSELASVSLPNTGGPRHGLVQVPINAANLQGLAAASLTVTFDPAMLRGVSAHTGNLTPGWYLEPGTNTPGQLRISMASPGSTSTGSGVLAYAEFEVLGLPGTTSPLALTGVLLNDGAIQTETAAGSFAVNVVHDVRGTVSFWNGGAGVPGVLCTLAGHRVYAGTSGSGGAFTVAGAEAGDYTLTPSKSDNTEGISAYDASLVLQHDAGLITLSGPAATAADVNQSDAITAFDAFYILQKAVDLIQLPFPGAGQVWTFDPASRSYPMLNSSQAGQDFTAILLGNVSGNWAPPSSAPGLLRAPSGLHHGPGDGTPAVTLALGSLNTQSTGTQVWLLMRAQDADIYSLDLVLTNAQAQGVSGLRIGALAETMAMSSNTNLSGLARVALAGAMPVQGVGALLILTLPEGQSNGLALVSASINEGAVPVEIAPDSSGFDADTDGDGQTDWIEIRAGTSPTDAQSRFELRSLTLETGGARRIVWSSVPHRSYRVLCLDGGRMGVWQPLASAVTASADEASMLDDAVAPATARLYRVQLIE